MGPTYAEGEGEYAEVGCNLVTPVEHVLFDLLVHRDFEWAMSPELILYSRLDGGGMQMTSRRKRNILPLTETAHDAGWGVEGLATALMTDHSRLVRYMLERLDWNADDFRGFRFSMSYPPIPTVALLRSKLPTR